MRVRIRELNDYAKSNRVLYIGNAYQVIRKDILQHTDTSKIIRDAACYLIEDLMGAPITLYDNEIEEVE